ncbi:hypothetical protein [Povalibacter sp.]|uniref:hypothetical protein n=1 Tax=Povalibacter sp. TaxID=1962978 RepID=UPI002F3E9059
MPVGARRRTGKQRSSVHPDLGRASANSLETLLDVHRGQLLRIESVVACLHVALLHSGEAGPRNDPNFASAAAIALTLLREAVDRLDARFITPLIRPLLRRRSSAAAPGTRP